jgi:2-dehydro-3-deoxyphosphogluconate aldolase/(4S)-4-hydroxy-2-oxoglutarate aldolase
MSFFDVLTRGLPALPIVTSDDGLAVARALDRCTRAGITAVEITSRLPQALSIVERVANHLSVAVGVGPVLGTVQLRQAADAGARFAVSPGLTPTLLVDEARRLAMPYLPGVSTSSEILEARAAGLRELKLYPADSVGGPRFLRAISQVYPDVRFVPTGGVNLSNAKEYLDVSNFMAIGGSWLAEGIGDGLQLFATNLKTTHAAFAALGHRTNPAEADSRKADMRQ